MQNHKDKFRDKFYSGITFSNVQPCIRLNDLEEIGDGTHLLYFNMVGLFSFRSWTVKRTIDFWMEFLINSLEIKPDYVTIHPDRIEEWSLFYTEYNIEVRPDNDCIWSDGELGGYCTEFYKDGIEIGNIVNCNGDCIDVGFGLERLELVVNGTPNKTDIETLQETINMIIGSGYVPGPKEQGYVLRKLLRLLWKKGGNVDHEFFKNEKERQEKLKMKYEKIKNKCIGKSKEWWMDTHGIDIDMMGH